MSDSIVPFGLPRGRALRLTFTTAPLLAALWGCASAQSLPVTAASSAVTADSLPVRRVQLYETGIGYFERAGTLPRGVGEVSLPAAHVDDALKTMVIFADGAPSVVGSVEYESVLSEALARVQAGLPGEAEQDLTYATLLRSLRGAKIEVLLRNGKRTEGRLVEVTVGKPESSGSLESKAQKRSSENEAVESAASELAEPSGAKDTSNRAKRVASAPRYYVTVVDPTGAIIQLNSARIASIRPLEQAIAKRLDAAIATATGRSALSPRLIRISSTANVPIRIGYITETPVWRVTYRLILDKAAPKATLQGWVLIHNDTDEPWKDVSLEIINGKPDSFLYPLTAPRYLRRTLNSPDEEMSTLPQLARKTPDQIWGDHEGDQVMVGEEIGDSFGSGGLGLSGVGEGHGAGYGSTSSGHLAGAAASNEITVGNLAGVSGSEAVPSGANFRYKVAQPVALSAHGSALVPFTQVPLSADLLTRFGWDESSGRVSVQLGNQSGQTLPAGPIAIYGADGLSGESMLARLPSGRSSWLTYGTDLDTEIESRGNDVQRTTTKVVRFVNGTQLVEHYVNHRERALHVSNRSSLKRQICLELPVESNAQVMGADNLKFDETDRKPLAIFELAPRSELYRTLVMEEALQRSTELSRLTEKHLSSLIANKELDAPARGVLTEALTFLTKSVARSSKVEALRERQQQLEKEVKRLETTLEMLKGTDGGSAAPLVRRVVELEATRHKNEAEEKALIATRDAELEQLAKILARLNPVEPTK